MKSLKKYLLAFGISIAIALIIFMLFENSAYRTQTPDYYSIYHNLSDAFFVVGVVDACMGLLIFVSNEGAFDMIVYGVSSFIDLFRSQSKKKYPTFYDYRMAKSEKKTNSWFLLIVGLVLILFSVLMLLIDQK